MDPVVKKTEAIVDFREGRPRRKASDVAVAKIHEYYKVKKAPAVVKKDKDEKFAKGKLEAIHENVKNKKEPPPKLQVLKNDRIQGTEEKYGDNSEKRTDIKLPQIETTSPNEILIQSTLRRPCEQPLVVFGNWQLALALAQSAQKHPLSYKMEALHKPLDMAQKFVLNDCWQIQNLLK